MNIITNGEFGYELVIAVPYAYYLHLQNKLTSTTSCLDTKSLYYFSNNHVEKFDRRQPCLGTTYDIKGATIHSLHTANPDFSRWVFPNYKEFYKNTEFIFEKPLLIISNKKYSNGSTQRHGFFNNEELSFLFDKFHLDYQIIYNRAKSSKIIIDTQIPNDIDTDFELIKKYNIIDINELHDRYKDKYTFNTLQLMLNANCERFISVQGGSSILSSAFGGKNLIYAFGGEEILIGSYKNWYGKFSNCKVDYTSNFNSLKNMLNNF